MTKDKPIVIPTPDLNPCKKGGKKYPFEEMQVNTMFKVHMNVKYKSIENHCYRMSGKLGKKFRLATFDADPHLYVVRLA